jgi:hypothetical protein
LTRVMQMRQQKIGDRCCKAVAIMNHPESCASTTRRVFLKDMYLVYLYNSVQISTCCSKRCFRLSLRVSCETSHGISSHKSALVILFPSKRIKTACRRRSLTRRSKISLQVKPKASYLIGNQASLRCAALIGRSAPYLARSAPRGHPGESRSSLAECRAPLLHQFCHAG